MTGRPWRFIQVILSVPGVVGFFLPFTWYISPLEVVVEWPDWFVGSLGVLAGLAFPIFVWQLRCAIWGQLSRFEIVACVVFGVAASIAILSLFTLERGWPELAGAGLGTIAALLIAGTHLLVVLGYRRRFLSNPDAALAALMGGYMPNAIIGLLGSWEMSNGTWVLNWDIGAYVILLACGCYACMISVTTTRLIRGAKHKTTNALPPN